MNNQQEKPTVVMFHRLLKRQQSITDLHTALKPLLRSCHATGILPITNTLNNTYGTSRIWVMYSSIVLVTHLTLSYFAFRSTFTETTDGESSSGITNLGYRISAFSSVGLCTVFLTITIIRRLKIARFFKTVHLVTTSLMKTGVKFGYVRTYLLFHCQIVIGILLCVIVSYSTSIYTRDNVTNFLSRLISSLVVYVLACLFADCLLLMYQRFVIINARINMIHHGQVISNDSGVLDEIRVLANCHDMLCDAADYVNDAFMLQLLFFVLVVFITGLFTVFNNIKAVYRTTPMDNDDIMELIRHSIFTVYNSAVLTIMMMACTTTCNQVSIFRSIKFLTLFFFHNLNINYV